MSTQPPVEAPVTTPEAAEAFAPQPGIGVPLAVGTFGFSVLVLGLPTSRIISPDALGIFVPVAFGTGALGLFIGGLWEYRANNIFGRKLCAVLRLLPLHDCADPSVLRSGDHRSGGGRRLRRRVRCLADPLGHLHVHPECGGVAHQHASVSRVRAAGPCVRVAGDRQPHQPRRLERRLHQGRRVGPPRRRGDRVVFDFGSGAEPHRWARAGAAMAVAVHD